MLKLNPMQKSKSDDHDHVWIKEKKSISGKYQDKR